MGEADVGTAVPGTKYYCNRGLLGLIVQTKRFEAKKKSEDEIGRCNPSDWPKSQNEAPETGWARFSFPLSFNHFWIKAGH